MAIKISKNRVDMGSTPIKNVSYQDLDQVATQAAPAASKTRFYSKTDGALYVVPAAGSETAAGVPTNVVAFFNGAVASIPSGWTEFTAARGRMIVGVPLSGTVGGTVGTALTDLQDKSTTHTHTGPSHTHTGPSHTHAQNNGGGTSFSAQQGWYVLAASTSGSVMYANNGAGSSSAVATGVQASGTGATGADGTGATGTGAVATGDVTAYIQQPAIVKS